MRLGMILSSKILKKGVQIDQNSNASLAPKRAIRHSWSVNQNMRSVNRHFPSVDWPKFAARAGDFLIKIKPIFFDFLEIRTHSNSYLISSSIPTSINRGNKSELRAFLF